MASMNAFSFSGVIPSPTLWDTSSHSFGRTTGKRRAYSPESCVRSVRSAARAASRSPYGFCALTKNAATASRWAGLFVATRAPASAAEAPDRNLARRSASPGPSTPFGRDGRAAGGEGGDVSGPAEQLAASSRRRAAALFIAERFHRIEPRRLERGIEPEENPDAAREDERDHDRLVRDHALPLAAARHRLPDRQLGDDLRARDADQDAQDAPHQADRHRLDQELLQDVAPLGADRL